MPELFLMWSAAVILAAVAVAAAILLGFYLSFVAREIGDRLYRRRQRELTSEQVKEVRAFAKRLANENYKKRMARIRDEEKE